MPSPPNRLGELISVALPVYNNVEFVDEAVQSILQQTHENLELVIVDNGSTDGSTELLSRWRSIDSRVKLIRLDEVVPPDQSQNMAIEGTTGEFIAIMHGDDAAHPQRLERQLSYFRQNPGVDLCATGVNLFVEGQGVQKLFPPADPKEIKTRFLFGNCLIMPTVMLRRSTVWNSGLRFEPTHGPMTDFDYWLRAVRQFSIGGIAEPLFWYRQHPGQGSQARRDICIRHTKLLLRELLDECVCGVTDLEWETHWKMTGLEPEVGPADRGEAARWAERLMAAVLGRADLSPSRLANLIAPFRNSLVTAGGMA